jgi:hypothetical protein
VDRVVNDTKSTVILHLGDYDPSGESIFQATAEDVAAFVAEDRYDARQTVRFKRVALIQGQVAAYRLPTAPAKASDGRTKNWAERRGRDQTCQLEALPPDILARLLEDAIRNELDLEQLDHDLLFESVERRRVAYLLTEGRTGA